MMEVLRLGLERYLDTARVSQSDHPPAAELLAYRAGELDWETREKVSDHLVLCELCHIEYLDFSAWLRSTHVPDPPDSPDSTEVAWRWFRHRLGSLHGVPRSAFAPRTGRYSARWLSAALAASLVVCFGLTMFLQSRVVADRQPVVNAPIVELIPQSLEARRGEDGGSGHAVSSASPWIVLIAHPPLEGLKYDHAQATLFDSSGRRIWRSPVRTADGYYSILVPRSLLPVGHYRLVLSWDDGSESAEYDLDIAPETSSR